MLRVIVGYDVMTWFDHIFDAVMSVSSIVTVAGRFVKIAFF
jgi:hypothetical protein